MHLTEANAPDRNQYLSKNAPLVKAMSPLRTDGKQGEIHIITEHKCLTL
jgi:hypothetical protein